MAEPKNKNSKEWRDWYVRHHILGSGNTDLVRIAFKGGKNIEILKQFVDDVILDLKND